MGLTRNLITSAVAGSVAGVVANFFVGKKEKVKSTYFERPIKMTEDIKFLSQREEGHYFV